MSQSPSSFFASWANVIDTVHTAQNNNIINRLIINCFLILTVLIIHSYLPKEKHHYRHRGYVYRRRGTPVYAYIHVYTYGLIRIYVSIPAYIKADTRINFPSMHRSPHHRSIEVIPSGITGIDNRIRLFVIKQVLRSHVNRPLTEIFRNLRIHYRISLKIRLP